jgi:hypothetical protein
MRGVTCIACREDGEEHCVCGELSRGAPMLTSTKELNVLNAAIAWQRMVHRREVARVVPTKRTKLTLDETKALLARMEPSEKRLYQMVVHMQKKPPTGRNARRVNAR